MDGKSGEASDAYRDQVLIGGREARALTLVPYDPAWVDRFGAERRRIVDAIEDAAIVVEHIGSTSVPGLAAKPIVDIVLTVLDVEQDTQLVRQLEAAGYELRVREEDHLMFRTVERDVHIHVYSHGHGDVARYLVLRDRLRGHEGDRIRCEQVKRELVARSWRDMNDYADPKTAVIEEILRRAQAFPEADA